MKELKELVRNNIWDLAPYSCARTEFKGEASTFLDANENPYNEPYNRYPDPFQEKVKEKIAQLKSVATEQIFLGNGSDEAIDLVIRIFCEPISDNVVAIAPTYGMYQVAADINNVPYRKVLLNNDFSLDAQQLLDATDEDTKIVFLCSPNNPTGNALEKKEVLKVVEGFQGIVVIDEAYIDFSEQPSFLNLLTNYPNVIVLQTFSKAWGLAAIRLGMAFASKEIISFFNKVKYPYNVNLLTQQKAFRALNDVEEVTETVNILLYERNRLKLFLAEQSFVKRIYPTDANFLLVKVYNANDLYQFLIDQGVVVRNRTNVSLCENCLRITVGSEAENKLLFEMLEKYATAAELR